jgi:hypothetical protein
MPHYGLVCEIERLPEWHPRLYLEPDVVACVAVLSRYSSSPVVID